MILISHRGNTEGKIEKLENSPLYIVQAIEQGFDVEIDIHYVDGQLWLGHDKPQYPITIEFLELYKDKLWIHCKNLEAVTYLKSANTNKRFNYFWHQKDEVTITSKEYIWAYPGINCKDSIAVLPEIFNDNINNRIGVCSDVINDFI